MKTVREAWVLWICAIALLGCGTPDPEIVGLDVSGLPEAVVPDRVVAEDLRLELESVAAEEILPVADALEVEVILECQPGDGCFGDSCQDAADCLSGLCLDHMGDKVCSQTCIEECPDGWSCELVSGFGPDVNYVCLSPFSLLCRPCVTSDDCTTPTGLEEVCVDYGENGRFCGAKCGDSPCPNGFSCLAADTAEGTTVQQCVADAGVCLCSQTAVELGLFTVCSTSNDLGSCEGKRTCGADGLGACDALAPSIEECNGIDDDCDGEIDNGVCDDENACTSDQCDPDAGCVHEPLTGTECGDLDVCTLADHCLDGECVGTAIDCADDNPCTVDNCDPAGGCNYTFNSADCDDDDPCTVADECNMGICDGFPVDCECVKDSDCLTFEDGDVCNGTLICDTGVVPHECAVNPGSAVACPEPEGQAAQCQKAQCHPVTGECTVEPANEGQSCDDGDECTFGEACSNGVCQGDEPVNCNDGNPCTDDLCEPEAGCFFENNQADCDDGDLCTVSDICADGACLSGSPLACDDGNVCTDDTCDGATGCVHAANQMACDDGNACTTGDQCQAGTCDGTGNVDCVDDNPCTDDWCDPVLGCSHADNQFPCDDDDACTAEDQCAGGSCVGGPSVNCNDGNLCTNDSCDPALGCAYQFNDSPCNDADACTPEDQCKNGVCEGTGLLDCDDVNVCTDDSCHAKQGCVHQFNAEPCDDDNVCTLEDACGGGSCGSIKELTCDDDNLCTDDSCDPESGCHNLANQNPCDDDNPCTTSDVCEAKECVGASPLNCNDGNVCTDDSCDSQVGCVYGTNQGDCSDDDACTVGDQCLDGICASGQGLPCDDGNLCTDDSCAPETGCVFSANSAVCDDGNECTEVDVCADGQCMGDVAPDCDDSNPCTTDVCLWDTGCSHFPVPAGADMGLCSECDGKGELQAAADDADCGDIGCSGLDYKFAQGEASATGTNHCILRAYQNLAGNRCKEPGICKEADGPDCTDWEDQELAECGPCSFAEGACDSCQDYADGTVCDGGKWCQAGTCVVNMYGDGSDGNLVVAAQTLVVNDHAHLTDSEVSAAAVEIPVSDDSQFAAGDEVLIIQMQHQDSAGMYEFAWVESVNDDTVTVSAPLANSYYSAKFDQPEAVAAQMVRVPQYADVTVEPNGKIVGLTWNGYVGGIVVFRATGTVNIKGAIDVIAQGFRAGPSTCCKCNGHQGEGFYGIGTTSTAENYGGGGGSTWSNCGGDATAGGSGGGGYGAPGETGKDCNGCGCGSDVGGVGGVEYGEASLEKLFLGGGSGSNGRDNNCGGTGAGGSGGGIIRIVAQAIEVSGVVSANGKNNSSSWAQDTSGPSSGAGGSIHMSADSVDVGTGKVTASPGAHGYTHWCCKSPSSGAVGRIRLDAPVLSGTTLPPYFQE